MKHSFVNLVLIHSEIGGLVILILSKEPTRKERFLPLDVYHLLKKKWAS